MSRLPGSLRARAFKSLRRIKGSSLKGEGVRYRVLVVLVFGSKQQRGSMKKAFFKGANRPFEQRRAVGPPEMLKAI